MVGVEDPLHTVMIGEVKVNNTPLGSWGSGDTTAELLTSSVILARHHIPDMIWKAAQNCLMSTKSHDILRK